MFNSSLSDRFFPDYRRVDPLLVPYIYAHDETEARAAAETMFSKHTMPLVNRIVRARTAGFAFDSQESNDLQEEVVLRLWIRLIRAREHRESEDPIACWSTYVQGTTQNVLRGHLRQKRPAWHRLKNRIRYVLTRHAEFALWETQHGLWLCGPAASIFKEGVTSDRLNQIMDGSIAIEIEPPQGNPTANDLVRLLRRLFAEVDGAVDLDAVIRVVLQLWKTEDYLEVSTEDPAVADRIVAPEVAADDELGRRESLRRLWSEICILPLNQRRALLLNLRGDDRFPAIELFPIAGVATIAAIAKALDESADDFARLWPNLPLDDTTIAKKLRMTRQQVINLRKSARERLRRSQQKSLDRR